MTFRSWRNRDRELDEEIQSHLRMAIQERIERGMSSAEAEVSARREFGNVSLVQEVIRDMWEWSWLRDVGQDVRFAARVLMRTPFFLSSAVLSLGLGIAGNTVVFSLADAYVFRNRPGIAEPHRLVDVGRIDTGEGAGFYSGGGFDTFSYPNYLDYRERQTVFEALAAYHVGGIATFGLGTSDDAVRVSGAYVSANFFTVLGVRIALGRGFVAEWEAMADGNRAPERGRRDRAGPSGDGAHHLGSLTRVPR